MLNKVMLIGRLGRDPEEKTLPSGTSVSSFSIATDESYKDKQGEKVTKTEWHRIIAFAGLADICNKYLAKGSLVYVDGKLQTRSWESKDGAKHQVTEIVAATMKMLGDKREAREPDPSATPDPGKDSDDVPF